MKPIFVLVMRLITGLQHRESKETRREWKEYLKRFWFLEEPKMKKPHHQNGMFDGHQQSDAFNDQVEIQF